MVAAKPLSTAGQNSFFAENAKKSEGGRYGARFFFCAPPTLEAAVAREPPPVIPFPDIFGIPGDNQRASHIAAASIDEGERAPVAVLSDAGDRDARRDQTRERILGRHRIAFEIGRAHVGTHVTNAQL